MPFRIMSTISMSDEPSTFSAGAAQASSPGRWSCRSTPIELEQVSDAGVEAELDLGAGLQVERPRAALPELGRDP